MSARESTVRSKEYASGGALAGTNEGRGSDDPWPFFDPDDPWNHVPGDLRAALQAWRDDLMESIGSILGVEDRVCYLEARMDVPGTHEAREVLDEMRSLLKLLKDGGLP